MRISSLLKSVIVYTLLIALPVSCMLEGDKDNFVEIDKKPNPNNLSDIGYSYYGNNSSTIYPLTDTLWLDTDETVKISLFNGSVLGYEVWVDSSPATSGTVNGSNVSFDFRPSGRTPGPHQLKFVIQIKSGTGSFADQMGAEYVPVTYGCVLMVGDMRSFVPRITRMEQADGTVHVSWNRYPYGDFQSYELRKYESYSWASAYRKIVITDRNQTTCDDPTNVGGGSYYQIFVNRGGKYLEEPDFNWMFIDYKPNMGLERLANGKLRLSWDRPLFYKNIKTIRFSRASQAVGTVTDGALTSVEIDDDNRLFGQLMNYGMTLEARVDDPGKTGQDITYYNEDVTLGKRTPPFVDVKYNAPKHSYYFATSSSYYSPYRDAAYKLDEDLNITDTLKLKYNYAPFDDSRFVQSPDGSYLYLLDRNRIYPIDEDNMTFLQEYYANAVFSTVPEHHENFSISNTNVMVYPVTYVNSVNAQKTIVKNLTTQQVLLELSSIAPAHVSADGAYFVHSNNLYQYNGTNAFTFKSTLPYTNVRYVRFLDPEKKLLIATADKVIVFNFQTAAEVSSYAFDTSTSAEPRFNTFSQEYVVNKGSKLMDISTGQVRELSLYSGFYAYRIQGHYLFTSTGFGLKPY